MLNEGPIIDRLRAADRAHQKELGGSFFLKHLKLLWLLVIGGFAADVLLHLSPAWRLGLTISLILAALVLACTALYKAFGIRNRLEHVARLIESREECLGSSLINLLQLRDQANDSTRPALTRDLAARAVANYGHTLEHLQLEELAKTGVIRRDLRLALLALVVFGVLLAAFAPVTRIELPRFADPFGDHPPYSLTRLEIVDPGPAGTNVLYSKGFVVRATAGGHRPKEVFLTAYPTARPAERITLPMFEQGGAKYNQLLDNISEELTVFAHTKDRASMSHQARIGVILTPQLEKAYVRIVPPAYTRLKAEEKVYAFLPVQALAGSTISFRLQSNRPLRDGVLDFSDGQQQTVNVRLTNSAPKEVSGAIEAATSGRIRFDFFDVAGNPTLKSMEGALTVTHDLPPIINITEPVSDMLVAIDFKPQVHFEAGDDYGISQMRIHRGIDGSYGDPETVTYNDSPRSIHEARTLDFAALGVKPGSQIALYAEAIDTAPQAHLSRSRIVRLTVISVEDYNNLLRRQTDIAAAEAKYAELQEELQSFIEEQKKLAEKADQLQKQLEKAAGRATPEMVQQTDALLARQNELNQKLKQQAERLENFVRDHPLYDVEEEFRPLLKQEGQRVRNSAMENTETMEALAAKTLGANGNRQLGADVLQDFGKAAERQIANLSRSGKEIEKNVVEALKEMGPMQELIKDFNLFYVLHGAQKELAEQTAAYNRQGTLTREDQLALKDLASAEKQITDLLSELQGKLETDADAAEKRFPKAAESGRKLADQMQELRLANLGTQATGQMLAGNGERSFRLADRLREEMEKLMGQCNGNGNCPSSRELDQFLALCRALNPGRSFAQMAQSHNFGFGNGQGMGLDGQGMSGMIASQIAGNPSLMGNERFAQNGAVTGRQEARQAKPHAGVAEASAGSEIEKADAIKGMTPVNRKSGAVSSEAAFQQYEDLVESYFRTITTQKK
jgi:ElaB/YqjD/DUF883 family membrane-anchored ribosome-binding protein